MCSVQLNKFNLIATSVWAVPFALRSENMQYNFRTCEMTLVLEDGNLRDLFQGLQIKLTSFSTSGTSYK
jgi:hypothetical protein